MEKKYEISELLDHLNAQGRIDNKEIAKQLLLITPDAWGILSSRLKHDKELMLLYQPESYLINKNYVAVNFIAPYSAVIMHDRKFKLDSTASVSGNCDFRIEISSFVPRVFLEKKETPEKLTLLEEYMQIQREMKIIKTKISEQEFKERCKWMQQEIHAPRNYTGLNGIYNCSYELCTLDRSNLEEIVSEALRKH